MQCLPMSGGTLDVGTHTLGYVLRLLFAHLFYALGRSADYEASGRELFTFGYEGAGGYYRALAYPGTVQYRGAHPYEAPVPDLAPVHNRSVADHTILAHNRRIPRVRVQHAAILDVGARSYPDGLSVAPEHRSVPDA